jgi:hypothetical protein
MEQTSLAVKLKAKDVKATRIHLLEKQGFRCTLCHQPCSEDQAVLDHDHTGGHIRSVLHRGCNAAEGKIMNAMRRYGIKNPLDFLAAMVLYQQTHATNQTGWIHPIHRTPEEKAVRVKARAKKKREAIKKAKTS